MRVKNLPVNTRDARDEEGSIPGSGRFPGGEHGTNPVQYSCRENPMDRERSRAGYGPQCHKELDTTEAT